MIGSIAAFIPPFIIGTLIVGLVFQESIFSRFLLKLSLGFGAGMGITSCLYFFWSLASNPARQEYFIIEAVLLIALFTAGLKTGLFVGTPIHFKTGWEKMTPVQRIILCGSVILLLGFILSTVLDFYYLTTLNPHGRYDTYNIWDYRARMIFRAGQYWLESFSTQVWHSDYPLLVPLNTARGWLLLGREYQQVPALQGIFFALALVALMFSALSQLRDYSLAFVSAFILLGLKNLIPISGNHLADTPLAFYMLAFITSLVFFIRFKEKRPGMAFLAGLFAGLAAWTKNEGSLILVFSALCLAVLKIKTPFKEFVRILLFFAAGIALPLAAYLYFKSRLAPPATDYADFSDLSLVYQRAVIFSRYETVIARYASGFVNFTFSKVPALLLVAIYAIFSRFELSKQRFVEILVPLSLILFLLPVYMFNYVTSPLDLVWYMATSMERILWQIFPVLLLAIFLIVRSPRQVFSKEGYNLPK